jgi:hypothetical protein
MSELQLPPRRASLTVAAAFLIATFLSVALVTASGQAAQKPAKCPVAKKKKGLCPKISSRLRYKTVRRSFVVLVPHASVQEGVSEVVTVECPHGEQVLGGGVEVFEPFLTVTLSAPNEATDGWSAQIANLSTTTDSVASVGVYAVCEIPAVIR